MQVNFTHNQIAESGPENYDGITQVSPIPLHYLLWVIQMIVNKIGTNTDDNGTLPLTPFCSFCSQRELFIMTLNKDFIHSPVIMYFP